MNDHTNVPGVFVNKPLHYSSTEATWEERVAGLFICMSEVLLYRFRAVQSASWLRSLPTARWQDCLQLTNDRLPYNEEDEHAAKLH